jgi:hypothetical protein
VKKISSTPLFGYWTLTTKPCLAHKEGLFEVFKWPCSSFPLWKGTLAEQKIEIDKPPTSALLEDFNLYKEGITDSMKTTLRSDYDQSIFKIRAFDNIANVDSS